MDFADPAVRADRPRDVLDGPRSHRHPLVLEDLRAGGPAPRLRDLRPGRRTLARSRAGAVQRQPRRARRRHRRGGRARRSSSSGARRSPPRAICSAPSSRRAGLRVHPSHSNFVLVELGVDDQAVSAALMRRGILVRGGTRVRPARLRARDGRARGRDAADGRRARRRGARCLISSPTGSRAAAARGRRGDRRLSREPPAQLGRARRACGPIITRTERVAVNIADGFARATNGERIVPCVTQYGPGAEAAFAAVAQAYGDRSPILLLPSEHDVAVQGGAAGAQRVGLPPDHALRGDRSTTPRAAPRCSGARSTRCAARATARCSSRSPTTC